MSQRSIESEWETTVLSLKRNPKMCHWVLRIWQCGDSFFTKYSSCSFDRAAHDPAHLLNPLHPSITPLGKPPLQITAETTAPPERVTPVGEKVSAKTDSRSKHKRNSKRKAKNDSRKSTNCTTTNTSSLSLPPALRTAEHTSPHLPNLGSARSGEEASYARDAKTGETIPILLSEIGKASRFGDKTLGEGGKCYVFEVVLQTKEPTMCPACSKNPLRARLPAHARGCFAPS